MNELIQNSSLGCQPAPGQPSARGRGFSLVEVVLALGIMSFGLVAIFGLLPVGLASFRTAMNATIAQQIVQEITNEAQLTDFSRLKEIEGDRFYDDEGKATEEENLVFSADVEVVQPVPVPSDGTVDDDRLVNRANLAKVIITIAWNQNRNKPSKHTVVVPDNGF